MERPVMANYQQEPKTSERSPWAEDRADRELAHRRGAQPLEPVTPGWKPSAFGDLAAKIASNLAPKRS